MEYNVGDRVHTYEKHRGGYYATATIIGEEAFINDYGVISSRYIIEYDRDKCPYTEYTNTVSDNWIKGLASDGVKPIRNIKKFTL